MRMGGLLHVASLSQYGVRRPPLQGKTMNARSLHADHSTAEIVHAAKCELAEKALRRFGSLRLRVTGLSMIPAVWPGDLLMIRRQEMEQIYPGDIVLFARHGRLIAHRVVFKTDSTKTPILVTRGDALPSQDCAISPADLLGKVSGILRAGDWIQPRRRASFSARIIAMVVSRSGWAAGIVSRLRTSQRLSCEREVLCQS
jgi:signal peptidase